MPPVITEEVKKNLDKFKERVERVGKLNQNNITKVVKTFCEYYNEFVDSHDQNTINEVKQYFDQTKEFIANHADLSYIGKNELYNAIEEIIKIGREPDGVINSWANYYAEHTPEEERYVRIDGSKNYKEMEVGKHDIISEATRKIKNISEDTINRGWAYHHDRIEFYNTLKKANEQRPWYSKLWSAIKGIFTMNEDKVLNKLKNTIIEKSGYDKGLMEKAFKAEKSDYLESILKVADEKYKNSPKERESMDIDNNLVNEEPEQNIDYSKVNDISKEISKDELNTSK